jgi:hypothetical protein
VTPTDPMGGDMIAVRELLAGLPADEVVYVSAHGVAVHIGAGHLREALDGVDALRVRCDAQAAEIARLRGLVDAATQRGEVLAARAEVAAERRYAAAARGSAWALAEAEGARDALRAECERLRVEMAKEGSDGR